MRHELTVSLGSSDDVSGSLAHDMDHVQWTVRLTSDHDRSMSRFRFYLVTMTTTALTRSTAILLFAYFTNIVTIVDDLA